jgi:hypothetical protein
MIAWYWLPVVGILSAFVGLCVGGVWTAIALAADDTHPYPTRRA